MYRVVRATAIDFRTGARAQKKKRSALTSYRDFGSPWKHGNERSLPRRCILALVTARADAIERVLSTRTIGPVVAGEAGRGKADLRHRELVAGSKR